jgi:hypothetical protein
MKEIKIRNHIDGTGDGDDSWVVVSVLDADSRPGWIHVQQGAEAQWLALEEVHPADQVALRVEGLAKRRYEWVPTVDTGE